VDGVTDMPVAYCYPRWSSDEQGDGSSLDRQQFAIQNFVAAHGHRATWIVDDGVPARDGYNLKHGRIAKLRADIIAGRREPGMIVVAEPSRLSRADEWVTFEFLAPLMTMGCTLGVVSRNMILRRGDREGLFKLFAFSLEQVGGHLENEKRLGMVGDETRLRRSKLVAEPGTKYSARVPDWLVCPKVTGRGRFVRDVAKHPLRCELVEEVFRLAADGYGSVRIAEVLNKRIGTHKRYTPWRGDRFTPDWVVNLLANRAVLGEFQPHKVEFREGAVANPDTKHKRRPFARVPDGELISDYFPRVISQDLWDRVQAAKARRATVKSGRPSRENVNLFAGLCHCGECGHRMHLYGKNERGKNDYLRCSTVQSRAAGCSNRTYYSVQRLERAFVRQGISTLATAADFASPADHLDDLVKRVEAARDAVKNASRRLTNARAAVAEADSQDERAMYRATAKDMLKAMEQAEAERDRLERDLEAARGDDAHAAMRAADELTGTLEAGNHEARMQFAELIRTTVSRVDFHNGRVFITPRRPASVPMSDDAGVSVPRVPRQGRRIVVEFLEGSRGRRIVDDAEVVFIEGRDMRDYAGADTQRTVDQAA
jgi:NACalpha-BTF3-like transcription factor